MRACSRAIVFACLFQIGAVLGGQPAVAGVDCLDVCHGGDGYGTGDGCNSPPQSEQRACEARCMQDNAGSPADSDAGSSSSDPRPQPSDPMSGFAADDASADDASADAAERPDASADAAEPADSR